VDGYAEDWDMSASKWTDYPKMEHFLVIRRNFGTPRHRAIERGSHVQNGNYGTHSNITVQFFQKTTVK